MIRMYLTTARLKKAGACSSAINSFKRAFNLRDGRQRVYITKENWDRASGNNRSWLVTRYLGYSRLIKLCNQIERRMQRNKVFDFNTRYNAKYESFWKAIEEMMTADAEYREALGSNDALTLFQRELALRIYRERRKACRTKVPSV